MQRHIRVFFPLLILVLLTSACGIFRAKVETSSEGGWLDGDGFSFSEPVDSTGDIAIEAEYADEAGMPAGKSAGAATAEGVVGAPSSSGEAMEIVEPIEVEEREEPMQQQPNLRAGSVDDNEEWDDYLHYRIQAKDWNLPVHDLDVTERHIIEVTNGQGLPVLGAEVEIFDTQGRRVAQLTTYADGRVLFFPNICSSPDSQGYDVSVSKGSETAEMRMDRQDREHQVTLDARSATHPVRLDVHFLIDATGSMSDEINQLKNNMIQISEQISELGSQPDVRFAMTVYRDRGDDFVSRTYDFTPNVNDFTDALQEIQANGGGDYPESLNEGLHDALHKPEWRLDETISLVFLIADAPPHLDYDQDYDYAAEVLDAAEAGIKIYPLASSGLDDQGEYIFRQLAQITNAKFLFLTYGAGGGPGYDTDHHVDDYSVLSLDQMVVRIIEEELAFANAGQ